VTIGLFSWPAPFGYTWAGSAAFDWVDPLSLLADGLVTLGLIAGGIFTLRTGVLPRWNAAPLLLGLWLVFSTISTLLSPRSYFVFYNSFTPPTPPQDLWVLILVGAMTSLLWGMLGVGLWPGKYPAPPQAQPVIVPTP
jgi:hypothetical protein